MKIPKPKKLPSGNYFIRLRLGGQDIGITKPTAKECTAEAMYVKSQYKLGYDLEGYLQSGVFSELTVGGALERFIDNRSNILSPSTIRNYRGVLRNRFQEALKSPLTDDIDWQRIINQEAKEVSPKTLSNAFAVICSVYRDCGLSPPKASLPSVISKERPYLLPNQIPTFLDAVKGSPCEMSALLALHSLRRSEILALTRDKIYDDIIHVEGAVVYNERNERVYKVKNKNATSLRTVPIMIPRLKELVEAVPKGKPLISIAPNTMRKQINRVCRAADLPEVGVHGLRHSFASLAYHIGLPERECMEIGGWSDRTTMHKIYTHVGTATRQQSVNKMAEFYKSI